MGGIFGTGLGLDPLWASLAREDMQQFQEKMMKNKYQWQVADLKSAGLNPILTVAGGGGQPGMNAPGSGAGTAPGGSETVLGSARSIARWKREMKILDSQVVTAKNQEATSFQTVMREGALGALAENQSLREFVNLEIDRAKLPSAKAILEFDSSKMGRKLIKAHRAMGYISGNLPFSAHVGAGVSRNLTTRR